MRVYPLNRLKIQKQVFIVQCQVTIMKKCRAETQNSPQSTFEHRISSGFRYQLLMKYCNSHRYTGTGAAFVANRISYHFNLNGPSFTLDTGCSGSLVAIHEACKAIQSGEIEQALVGGTNLILDPEHIASMSSMQYVDQYLTLTVI